MRRRRCLAGLAAFCIGKNAKSSPLCPRQNGESRARLLRLTAALGLHLLHQALLLLLLTDLLFEAFTDLRREIR